MWLKHRHNKTTYDEEGSVSSGPGVKHSSSKSIASQRTTHTRGSSRKNGRNRNSQAAVRRGRSIDIDDNKSAVTASAFTIVLPSTSPLAESSEPRKKLHVVSSAASIKSVVRRGREELNDAASVRTRSSRRCSVGRSVSPTRGRKEKREYTLIRARSCSPRRLETLEAAQQRAEERESSSSIARSKRRVHPNNGEIAHNTMDTNKERESSSSIARSKRRVHPNNGEIAHNTMDTNKSIYSQSEVLEKTRSSPASIASSSRSRRKQREQLYRRHEQQRQRSHQYNVLRPSNIHEVLHNQEIEVEMRQPRSTR